MVFCALFVFKQKAAYEMRISDWSSDVCSSDLTRAQAEYGVFICEQPLMGAEMLARVAERIDMPVMADESAWTVQDIIELHRLRAAECFSCYVTKPDRKSVV